MLPTLVHSGASLIANDRANRTVVDYLDDPSLLLSRLTTYAAQGYRPDPDATMKREKAKRYLTSLPAVFALKTTPEVGLSDLVFTNNNNKIAVFAPVFTAPLLSLGDGNKTIALIKRQRDPTFQRWTMSGWSSQRDLFNAEGYLPRAATTQLVRDIAAVINYCEAPVLNHWQGCH